MVSAYLASALVMGVLAVLIVAAIGSDRRWYSYVPDSGVGRGAGHGTEAGGASHEPEEELPAPRTDEAQASLFERTSTWIAVFVVLVLGAVAGVFAFVSNPESTGSITGGPVVIIGGLVVVGYLLVGVNIMARQRGHSDSLAAAETGIVAGFLLLLAVTIQLLGA